MDQISSIVMQKALDGLAMRQTYLAQNIANAGTPEYRPLKVTFENSLKMAAAQGVEAVEDIQPKVSYAHMSSVSDDMRLDLELAQASQTAMRYGALIDILGRQMSLHRLVINGGNS